MAHCVEIYVSTKALKYSENKEISNPIYSLIVICNQI